MLLIQIFDKSWDPPTLPPNPNSLPSGNCMTVAGPSSGVECIFPFIFSGITHTACTLHGALPGDKPWCSTKVDGNGNHIGGQEIKKNIYTYICWNIFFSLFYMYFICVFPQQGNWGDCSSECPVEGVGKCENSESCSSTPYRIFSFDLGSK